MTVKLFAPQESEINDVPGDSVVTFTTISNANGLVVKADGVVLGPDDLFPAETAVIEVIESAMPLP